MKKSLFVYMTIIISVVCIFSIKSIADDEEIENT